MTKDRLGELLMKRKTGKDSAIVEIEDGTTTGGNNLKSVFERAEVLKQWVDGIEENLDSIHGLLSKLDDLSVNHKELNSRIDSLFQNNTNICQKVNGKLKEIEEELKNLNDDSAEGRIKTIQYNTLKTRYMNVFRRNNAELENFKDIQKSRLEAQLRAKGVRVTDEELVALLDEKADIQLFTDNILAETAEAKRVLADIEERHQQLLKIERMLVEVRDLFLQMAILVDAQQDLIDRVEYQAVAAKEYVGKTPVILKSAAKKKAKYLKCKIISAVVIAILLVIIIVLLFK